MTYPLRAWMLGGAATTDAVCAKVAGGLVHGRFQRLSPISSFGISLRWDCIFYLARVWLMPRRLRAISLPTGRSAIETLPDSGRRRTPVSVSACRSTSFSLTI